MRVIFAECSAVYAGRGDTTLNRALRAILIKRDGSVSIHNDSANKPLNYMKMASREVTVNELGEEVWTFDARHESLEITLHRIISEVEEELVDKQSDPGGEVTGTEAHLQRWLFNNPHILGAGYIPIQREFSTGAGAVDLLVLSPEGIPVAVEVKRVATLGAVDQVRRYVESMRLLPPQELTDESTGRKFLMDFSKTQGLIAALDLRPKMLALAEKRGLPSVVIPAYWKAESASEESAAPDALEEPMLDEGAL